MHKAEWIALIISLAGVAAAFLVATRVFEAVPHVEDEMAYVWQAKVLAHGQMTAPTPPEPQSMYVPFVVDANGHRSAKYPPGWPMVLALGMLLGIRTWVNPLLGGLAIWLTFRLGQKICNSLTGMLAALLMLTSPFFLILSGSLDSNAWSLVLSIIFVLAWLDTFHLGNLPELNSRKPIPAWLTVSTAGLSLGLLVITRPLTALGVAVPFFLHGLLLLWRGKPGVRRSVLAIGGITLLVGSLFLAWQYVVTGNPLTDPYTLWWNFDRIGFGPARTFLPSPDSFPHKKKSPLRTEENQSLWFQRRSLSLTPQPTWPFCLLIFPRRCRTSTHSRTPALRFSGLRPLTPNPSSETRYTPLGPNLRHNC